MTFSLRTSEERCAWSYSCCTAYTQGSRINMLQQFSQDPNQLSATSRDPRHFCIRLKIQGTEHDHALVLSLNTAGK